MWLVKEIIEAKKLQEALKPSDDSGDRFRWAGNPVEFNSTVELYNHSHGYWDLNSK